MTPKSRTFVHQTAGSSTIMPNGRIIIFGGPKGGVGVYETADIAEIDWLVALSKQRLGQTSEVDPSAATATVLAADPVVKQAAEDAAKNTVLIGNQAVNTELNKLAAAAASITETQS
jgi:hypothetical protein